jgi:MraZ protein
LELIGETERSIDDKGRIVIPPELRASLGETCVLTRGFDNCINLYSKTDYENIVNQFKDLPAMDRMVNRVVRKFIGTPATIDGQGRLPISPALREFAGITLDPKSEFKGVVIFSTLDKIEIWSKESWIKYNADMTDEQFSEAYEKVIPRPPKSQETLAS